MWRLNVPVVHARVVTLHFQSGIRCYSLENKVVIAMWAELVTKKHSKVSHAYLSPARRITIPLFELSSVLAEALLALLACKDLSHAGQTPVIPAKPCLGGVGPYHLLSPLQRMGLLFLVAFGTVEPLAAYWVCF